jgi:hypothetical protein
VTGWPTITRDAGERGNACISYLVILEVWAYRAACKQRDAFTSSLVLRHKGGVAMSDKGDSQNVVVRDIHMPFWSMVVLMVKWGIASIPAVIILTVIGAVTWGILTGFIISSPTDKRTVSGSKMPSSVPTSAGITSISPSILRSVCSATVGVEEAEVGTIVA